MAQVRDAINCRKLPRPGYSPVAPSPLRRTGGRGGDLVHAVPLRGRACLVALPGVRLPCDPSVPARGNSPLPQLPPSRLCISAGYGWGSSHHTCSGHSAADGRIRQSPRALPGETAPYALANLLRPQSEGRGGRRSRICGGVRWDEEIQGYYCPPLAVVKSHAAQSAAAARGTVHHQRPVERHR